MRKVATTTFACLIAFAAWAPAGEHPVVFESDFKDGSLDGWKLTDPNAWEIKEAEEHGKVLHLKGRSKYSPKVRSPESIALLKDVAVSDFILDVEMKSTDRVEPHQDLCLFFGHQDAEHFYYVHLGRRADPHAHSVFLVNNEPRVSIAKERTDGTPWSDWHKVRIVRNAASGDIKVYFDDMENPVMHAVDKTFTWGKIGLGSFDNTGYFKNVKIRGTKVDPE